MFLWVRTVHTDKAAPTRHTDEGTKRLLDGSMVCFGYVPTVT